MKVAPSLSFRKSEFFGPGVVQHEKDKISRLSYRNKRKRARRNTLIFIYFLNLAWSLNWWVDFHLLVYLCGVLSSCNHVVKSGCSNVSYIIERNASNETVISHMESVSLPYSHPNLRVALAIFCALHYIFACLNLTKNLRKEPGRKFNCYINIRDGLFVFFPITAVITVLVLDLFLEIKSLTFGIAEPFVSHKTYLASARCFGHIFKKFFGLTYTQVSLYLRQRASARIMVYNLPQIIIQLWALMHQNFSMYRDEYLCKLLVVAISSNISNLAFQCVWLLLESKAFRVPCTWYVMKSLQMDLHWTSLQISSLKRHKIKLEYINLSHPILKFANQKRIWSHYYMHVVFDESVFRRLSHAFTHTFSKLHHSNVHSANQNRIIIDVEGFSCADLSIHSLLNFKSACLKLNYNVVFTNIDWENAWIVTNTFHMLNVHDNMHHNANQLEMHSDDTHDTIEEEVDDSRPWISSLNDGTPILEFVCKLCAETKSKKVDGTRFRYDNEKKGKNQYLQLLAILLDNNADVNCRNPSGEPLVIACIKEDWIDALKLIVIKKCAITAHDVNGNTALMYTMLKLMSVSRTTRKNGLNILKILLSAEIDLNRKINLVHLAKSSPAIEQLMIITGKIYVSYITVSVYLSCLDVKNAEIQRALR